MRSLLMLASLVLLCGCEERRAAEVGTCEALCNELVAVCEYGAFPTMGSCLQGCGYNFGEGADIEAHRACVQAAQCDTFAIVECENAHGRP